MTQIDVTFLGTTAGIPTAKRNHASIYLKYRSENEYCCLLDCGEGTQRQIFTAKLNFMRIDDIFVTHWHADHFAGIFGLMETMNLEQRTRPLNIYGPEADKFVETILELGYASKRYEVVAKPVPFEGSQVTKLIDTPEFSVCSVPAKHGIPAVAYAFVEKDRIKIDKEKTKKLGLPAKGLMYKKLKETGSVVYKGQRIRLADISLIEEGKKVVYSGDTLPCKNVVNLAKHASLLIHDSTFFLEDVFDTQYKHTTFEDVIGIIKEAQVKQAVLTHISRRYRNVEELKEKIKEYPNVKIARDFMTITLK